MMNLECSPKDKATQRHRKKKSIAGRHKGGNSPNETLLDAYLVSLLLLGLSVDFVHGCFSCSEMK